MTAKAAPPFSKTGRGFSCAAGSSGKRSRRCLPEGLKLSFPVKPNGQQPGEDKEQRGAAKENVGGISGDLYGIRGGRAERGNAEGGDEGEKCADDGIIGDSSLVRAEAEEEGQRAGGEQEVDGKQQGGVGAQLRGFDRLLQDRRAQHKSRHAQNAEGDEAQQPQNVFDGNHLCAGIGQPVGVFVPLALLVVTHDGQGDDAREEGGEECKERVVRVRDRYADEHQRDDEQYAAVAERHIEILDQ